MAKRKESDGKGAFVAGVAALMVIVGVISWLLFSVLNQKETRTSTTKEEGEMGVLECKTLRSDSSDTFFVADGELTGTHKVKIMMLDDKANEVAYEYSGTFDDASRANAASSKMHADYNIYMKEEAEKLTPVFSVIDNGVKISLYASGGKLNSLNAKMFFLTTDEMLDFYSFSRSTIEKIYKGKGFSCSYSK